MQATSGTLHPTAALPTANTQSSCFGDPAHLLIAGAVLRLALAGGDAAAWWKFASPLTRRWRATRTG